MLRRYSSGFSLIEIIVVMGVLSVILAILLPALQCVRETARRHSCLNNLHNLGIALSQYEDVYSRWPLNSTTPWTTALGPFSEQMTITSRWDTNHDAYDSQTNAELALVPWKLFACPSSLQTRDSDTQWSLSSYAINPEILSQSQAIVSDGRANTVFVSEICSQISLPWATGPALLVQAAGSDHQTSFGVLFGDGRATFIQMNVENSLLEAVGTVNGGEVATF